ncbi:MAG: N-6 DNA methylase [Candidatus Phytoplasma sp. TWB_XP]
MGDVYEYFIGNFTASSTNKAGEFFTPPNVSSLIAKIVTHGQEKFESNSLKVYDPTCGSGSLLLKVNL